MAHTLTHRTMEANENGRGNLPGYEVLCSCGFKMGTTLKTEVAKIQREHYEVMNRNWYGNQPDMRSEPPTEV